MSQIPPPPSSSSPQQPAQPGAYVPPSTAPGASRTNGMAIGSLVCGLLFCVPFVTGLAAIVLGFFGIKRANEPQVGGKGLAVTGLVLGVLSVGMWSLFGGAIIKLFKATEAERTVAKQFITDVAAGKTDAALAQTDGTITREEIQALEKTFQSWGPLTEVTPATFNYANGRCEITGGVRFGKTGRPFQMVLTETGEDVWKVSGVHVK